MYDCPMPRLSARDHERRADAMADLRQAHRDYRAAEAAVRAAAIHAVAEGVSVSRVAATIERGRATVTAWADKQRSGRRSNTSDLVG